jgi:WXG100 family type VII secretion target
VAGGASFRTEVATMEAAAAHVAAVADQLQAELAGLAGRLEPVMGAWQGQAAASFGVVKERWHHHAAGLNAALRNIAEGLGQAAQHYSTSEADTDAGFAAIAHELA